MRIAVDVMGGDHGSRVVVAGVKLALEAHLNFTELLLVGKESEIRGVLPKALARDARLIVVHAGEVLTMDDKPLEAVRKKKDCSMVRAVELVRNGQAEAVISTGNTGGLVATATLKLRRLEAVERPAIATVIPSTKREFVLIDSGATPECKPIHLLQFAIMGHVYSREMLGHKRPRVGILSNGSEAGKGNELTREAHKLCQAAELNYIGYVEGHDLFADRVDVVVADGFIGNIVLKTCESMGRAILRLLRTELTADPVRKFGALLAGGALRNIKHRMDPEAYGGAPLLGLKGHVIKAHGSAGAKAIMNAIRVATEAVDHHITDMIQHEVAIANERIVPARLAPAAALA
jgi:glycerol-3-phosphate acyltransferase PlsX